MDPRQAQLVRALMAQQHKGGVGRGANLSGVGGRALPFAQGLSSPLGVGGYWSTPISFNPAMGAGLSFAGNAAQGGGTAAAGATDSTGAAPGGVLPSDAAPNPGGGATQGSPSISPGYQSGAGDAPSPWIPPTPGPSASPSGWGAPPPGTPPGNAHYGGGNLGDPTDPFNYQYLYKNSFGY